MNQLAVIQRPQEAFLPSMFIPIKFSIIVGNMELTQFRDTVRTSNYSCAERVDAIGFSVSPIQRRVDLAAVTRSDLGFSKKVSYEEIFDQIENLGHKRCSDEVSFQLRMQFGNQDCGERLYVLPESTEGSCGKFNVYCVGREIGVGREFEGKQYIRTADRRLSSPARDDTFVFELIQR